MRLFILPVAVLAAALVIACGGSSSDGDPETEDPSSTPGNTVTPSTPVPAPPWVTSTYPPTEATTPLSAEVTPTPEPETQAPSPSPTSPVTSPPPTATPTQQQVPTPTPTEAPAPLHISVAVMNDSAFSPNRFEVPVGSTVTFQWDGNVPHNVVSPTAGFSSGDLVKSGSFSFTFNTPGTFQFLCDAHPLMKGLVTVTP